MFRTPRNIFGLLRQYCSDKPPSHDPEENVDLTDLTDNPTDADGTPQPQGSDFHPFPNKSSFLLGEWYWNGGVQKSCESFNELLSIVGHPDFRPEDIQRTKWSRIDAVLAKNDFDEKKIRTQNRGGSGSVSRNNVMDNDEDAEWVDEDAGWQKTPIRISVPFHNRLKKPGRQEYLAGELYHRSLVSIIREKLANPQDVRNFHYEPFELFWKPNDKGAETRVHGELYSSPTFLEAHCELQGSPGEPGCDLPRVVVAMMFSSDATQLTSYGNGKLWPSYLYFGNESKYYRCKPTSHLCNHVAYLQTVSSSFPLGALFGSTPDDYCSSQTHLKTLLLRERGARRPVRRS